MNQNQMWYLGAAAATLGGLWWYSNKKQAKRNLESASKAVSSAGKAVEETSKKRM